MSQLPEQLKILSYNIQTGLSQEHLHEYFTKSWRHLLPYKKRMTNLLEIAEILKEFDIVALQEIDLGSLRSGFINQIEFLARSADFPYWYYQINRNLGRIAKFCNAVVCRFQPHNVVYHRLPGVVPGRGAIQLFYGDTKDPLVIVIVHLSLGSFSQRLQIDYISQLIRQYRHVILMGDLNCRLEKLFRTPLLKTQQVRPVNYAFNTYPSWKPKYMIDHILVSSTITVEKVSVLTLPYSDHLPVAMQIRIDRE